MFKRKKLILLMMLLLAMTLMVGCFDEDLDTSENSENEDESGYSISGEVNDLAKDTYNKGLYGVTIRIDADGNESSTETDNYGNWEATIESEGEVTVTPAKTDYEFDPASKVVTASEEADDINFLATFTGEEEEEEEESFDIRNTAWEMNTTEGVDTINFWLDDNVELSFNEDDVYFDFDSQTLEGNIYYEQSDEKQYTFEIRDDGQTLILYQLDRSGSIVADYEFDSAS